ncbi:hypothetical protein [Bacteroides sp.]|uniref:hypothetical protein n=1 Tax=Bacteroides sp. TaxID=29523 RepID=UPI00258B70BD|nr:hypothetical protein [Bacteroides sp.]
MQRYRLPFFNYAGESLEIKFYMEDYIGEIETLTGAPSAFVVTGTDEEFVYEPVRTSTASVSIVTDSLLNDLFSVNSHHVAVKLYRGNKLLWTGYVEPEVFTQAYVPIADKLSINCISAIGTLENIQYEKQTENGFITSINLLRYIIRSANGGYEKIYIPYVYGSSEVNYSTKKNIFDEITLAEENFTSEGMMLDEVLEYFCRFFNWTLYDYEGSLYFVDADWKGEYFSYGEDLVTYEMVTPNTVLLQDIGFGGSDHTIDVLPGYNKVTVKAINNVFDELVENEDLETLKENGYQSVSYDKLSGDDVKVVRKRFLIPEKWELDSYDGDTGEKQDPKDAMNNSFGSALLKISEYGGKWERSDFIPDISDYSWTLAVQDRVKGQQFQEKPGEAMSKDLVAIKGAKGAAWMNGALSIDGSIIVPWDDANLAFCKPSGKSGYADITYVLRIGDKYWNGSSWVDSEAEFKIRYENESAGSPLTVKNTKSPDMPYSGLSGYIIKLPDNAPIIGDLALKIRRTSEIGFTPESGAGSIKFYGYIYKNPNLNYKKKDGVVDEGENGDRVYENVVNEKFMSELDEIEFGISSYNEDGATYSKALLNGNFLTNNLYSAIEGTLVRPEEALIRRIINRYRVTKIKLTQVLKNSDLIHPFTVLYDNSMVSKKFMLLSGVWDYEQNTVTLSMIENGDKVRYKNHK